MVEPFPPWWEQYPGRLEWEIGALEAAGITVTLNEAKRESEMVIELALGIPAVHTGVGDMQMLATFPDYYPFALPEVRAPGLALDLHQHPFGKNLCLIGRSSDQWTTEDRLAGLITGQLATALRLGSTGGGGDDEIDQGEPFSAYYSYAPDAAVLVDSAWVFPKGVKCGNVDLLAGAYAGADQGSLWVLPTALKAGSLGTFASTSPAVRQLFSGVELSGRWTLLPAPVRSDDARDLWREASRLDERDPETQTGLGNPNQFRLVAFPEQHHRGEEPGIGWVLLMTIRRIPMKGPPRVKPRRRPLNPSDDVRLIRAVRAGETDLAARLPARLSPLRGKHVAVIGLGALGSTVAVQLAKSGVGGLTLLDRDILEPGNSSRHACGTPQAGLSKARAVEVLARSHNPFVELEPCVFALGDRATDADLRQKLAEIYDEADLVIDASAEVGVQELTAHLARSTRTDWLMVEAENGAWGGTSVYIPGDADACFSCLQWHRVDGTIPIPHAEDTDPIQPVGCAEPTFTGASYDLDEVSLQAVRTAVGALLGEAVLGVDTVVLREDGKPCLPQWSHHEIAPHDQCRH